MIRESSVLSASSFFNSLIVSTRLRQGFQSADELSRWDETVQKVFPVEMVERGLRLIGGGVASGTDFSGANMSEDALRIACGMLHSVGNQIPGRLTPLRSSDIGVDQSSVLVARAKAEKHGACVFTGIEGALDVNALEQVSQMLPLAFASKADAAAAYDDVETFLVENSHWALPCDRLSFCLVHRRMCPLHPGLILRGGSEWKPAEELRQSVREWPSSQIPRPWWHEFLLPGDGAQDDAPKWDPLICNTAGL